MSIKAMTWARDQVVGGGSRKLVLLLLADYADDDGHCWPGIETVAEKAEVSEKTVRRHLNHLEEDGFVTRTRKRRRDGTMGVYEYQLRIHPSSDQNADSKGGARGRDAPAGKMTGGDGKTVESGATKPESPHDASLSHDPTSDPNAPAGKMTGGQNAAEKPDSGDPSSDQRSSCPSPPVNESSTTGHGDRAEPSGNYEQPEGPPSSSPSARESGKFEPPVGELEEFLGETHAAALDQIRELPGWSPMVEEHFLVRFVSGPMGELLLKGVPEEYRPSVIAETLHQFCEPIEGEPPPRWNGARFTGWLKRCGKQARDTVAITAKAEETGESLPDGSRKLDNGGVLLPDGRRLTATQAKAYERTRQKLVAMSGGGR